METELQTELEKLTMLENLTVDSIKMLEGKLKSGQDAKDAEMTLFKLGLERNILSLVQILKDKAFRK